MKNKLLATIRILEKQYSLHMEFMINGSFSTNDHYNIYQATISGGSFDVYGSRTRGIWIYYENGYMFVHTSSAVNGDKGYSYNIPTTRAQLKKWNKISISQTKVGGDYPDKVEMNGELNHLVDNTQPQAFQNVKIYISDPWKPAVPGYVRNVCIKGKDKLIIFGTLYVSLFLHIKLQKSTIQHYILSGMKTC